VRTILDETRKWIDVMVKATEQAQRAVDEGVEQSVLAGESIKALNSSVTESSQAASLIVTSSEQQFVGVDQVSSAMASIEQAMMHNSEGTSHLEDAAKRLEDLGQSLKELVRRYTE
jgi:methyl-accepting chemotaxis protein